MAPSGGEREDAGPGLLTNWLYEETPIHILDGLRIRIFSAIFHF